MCIILRRVKISGVEQTYYVGGASLISPAVILTAAHILKYDTLLRKGITFKNTYNLLIVDGIVLSLIIFFQELKSGRYHC